MTVRRARGLAYAAAVTDPSQLTWPEYAGVQKFNPFNGTCLVLYHLLCEATKETRRAAPTAGAWKR